MKRTPVHLLLVTITLIALIILIALLNAPRMLDSYAAIETAQAHQAAAEAMQTQATATILAVGGMLCLTLTMVLLVLGGLLLAYLSLANRPLLPDGRTTLPFSLPGHWPQLAHRGPTRRRPLLPPNTPPSWPEAAPPTPWRPEEEVSLPDGMDWAAWDWPDEDFPAF